MEYGLVVLWLVTFLALGMVGMPLAATLFPRLADRGAALALPVALAVVWLVTYLVGHLSLTAGFWLGLAVLLVASLAIVYHGVDIDRRKYGEVAGVFAVVFLFMIAIRSVDAGVHPMWGEKFLDYGLLKSVLRSDVLPPEDMWFAGRPVRYYYGGHLLAGLLTRLTGTDPRYGYNLALAGFYAALVTAAYGLAGSVAATRGVSRIRAGAFGAFFVGFAGNLSTAGHYLLSLLPSGLRATIASVFGFELPRLATAGRDGFHYFGASRIIDGTINEFPLFAWLNGDLHAHMMSTPFVLLVAGVLFSYYRTPERERMRRRLLVFGVVPPLGALLTVVNTWSFPTVGGLTMLALALAPTDPVTLLPASVADSLDRETPRVNEAVRYAVSLAGAVVVVLGGILWSLPFWLGAASGRSIGFFPDQSTMGELLIVHGAFALVFALYLLRHALPTLDRDHTDEVAVLLGLGVLLAWGASSAAAVALFGPMLVVGWILLRTQADSLQRLSADSSPVSGSVASDGGTATASDGTAADISDVVGFETLLLIAGAGIVILVEFVFVQEEAGPGRMNTVFKTYADVWLLWSVAASAMLAHLIDNHSPELALTGNRWRSRLQVFALVLLAVTATYGAFALTDHFGGSAGPYDHQGDPTLDGLRFVEEDFPTEANAIAWFDSLEGQPNIVEAPGRSMYEWSNPVASLTGIPTVAGWQHEVGYRGREIYTTRASHVDEIYTGPVENRAHFLAAYDVEYIYVGSNEREAYSQDELAAFDSMQGVTETQRWGDVVVYRVDHDALPEQDG
jgi:YYY domain-containing protein